MIKVPEEYNIAYGCNKHLPCDIFKADGTKLLSFIKNNLK